VNAAVAVFVLCATGYLYVLLLDGTLEAIAVALLTP